jgi:hypothetical protein
MYLARKPGIYQRDTLCQNLPEINSTEEHRHKATFRPTVKTERPETVLKIGLLPV